MGWRWGGRSREALHELGVAKSLHSQLNMYNMDKIYYSNFAKHQDFILVSLISWKYSNSYVARKSCKINLTTFAVFHLKHWFKQYFILKQETFTYIQQIC